jgi:signal transduction histidine kinase
MTGAGCGLRLPVPRAVVATPAPPLANGRTLRFTMIARLVEDIRSPHTYGGILYLLLAFPLGIVEFCVLVTGISAGLGLAITLIGIPILFAMLYLWRWMAQGERYVIGRLVGVPIADPYRPAPAHAGHWALIRSRLSDPATWKDLLFLLFQLPLGTLSFAIALALISGGGWLLTAPAWYWVDDRVSDFGVLTVDTLGEALLLVPIGALVLFLAIPGLGALARGYGWFAAQLLGSNADPLLTAEVSDLRDSRARVIAAADAERRRLERDLHDGAQQRLVSLSLTLRMAEQRAAKGDDEAVELLRRAGDEAGHALAELRDLARGIHPAILTNRGLAAALDDLAGRATVPVEVLGVPDDRLPDAVEAAAYFVVSECLANASKHAEASVASVRVESDGETVLVEVADDGIGGVELNGGSGLEGLDDRIGALDGRLDITSPRGGGTRVAARIPLRVDAHAATEPPGGARVLPDVEADAALARRRELLRPRLVAVAVVAAVLVAIWALTPSPTFWAVWPLIGLCVYAALDALITLVAVPVRESDLDLAAADRAGAARIARQRRYLVVKAGVMTIANLAVIAVWLASGVDYFWPVWVLLGTSVAVAIEYTRYRYSA